MRIFDSFMLVWTTRKNNRVVSDLTEIQRHWCDVTVMWPRAWPRLSHWGWTKWPTFCKNFFPDSNADIFLQVKSELKTKLVKSECHFVFRYFMGLYSKCTTSEQTASITWTNDGRVFLSMYARVIWNEVANRNVNLGINKRSLNVRNVVVFLFHGIGL